MNFIEIISKTFLKNSILAKTHYQKQNKKKRIDAYQIVHDNLCRIEIDNSLRCAREILSLNYKINQPIMNIKLLYFYLVF